MYPNVPGSGLYTVDLGYGDIDFEKVDEAALKQLVKEHKAYESSIPEDLCFVYGSHLEDYLNDVEICQRFARKNREKMAEILLFT